MLRELGRRLPAPRERDWQLFKHFMRYLKGTAGYVLTMTSDVDTHHIVCAKSDTGWAERRGPRKKHVLWNHCVASRTHRTVRKNAPSSAIAIGSRIAVGRVCGYGCSAL